MAPKNPASGNQTRQNLLDGAITAVRNHGIAGVSARTIAASADVNQALVFYHFGSVNQLLTESWLQATSREVEQVKPAFAGGSTTSDSARLHGDRRSARCRARASGALWPEAASARGERKP